MPIKEALKEQYCETVRVIVVLWIRIRKLPVTNYALRETLFGLKFAKVEEDFIHSHIRRTHRVIFLCTVATKLNCVLGN